MTTKTCTGCGETKSADQFSKDRRSADGLQRQCKDCYRAYREANRERIAAQKRAYKEANRGKINAYREENRDRIAARNLAYKEANRDKIAAQKRAYSDKHRDKIADQQRAYREAHREELATWRCEYREANRDKITAQKRAYNDEHREEQNAKARARYALVGNPSHERSQEVTARYATRKYDRWTPEEDRYILTGPGTIMDKALQLSRTHIAVTNRAAKLRRQENVA